MIEFFFDFETRSVVDISKHGAVKYALDPSTEATLLTWAVGDAPVKAWRKGQPVPQELVQIGLNPQLYKFIAHNVEFDYLIWCFVFSKLIKINKPSVENLECTQAMGQRFCAGRGLDSIAKILHLPFTKDQEGRRLMLKQCKPDKHGNFPELTPEEWDKFEKYGVIDTLLLRKAYRMMPKLSPAERWAFEWTTRRNLKGIRLDTKLLAGMTTILKKALPDLDGEFSSIVGHQFKVTQREKCLMWFKQYIPTITDMRAETISDVLLAPGNIPKPVIRALEIKSIAGSASIKKVATALLRNHKGRVYQNLVYNGAHTMRWAGSGLQVHNFPRVDSDFAETANDALHHVATNPDVVLMTHEDPVRVVKNLLRKIFIPDDGLAFYGGDYSKIEPTVLFWLLDMGPIPKNWYEQMAAAIYGIPLESVTKDGPERQLGKKANLSCGYGQGPQGFTVGCKKDGLVVSYELADKSVKAYRAKYPKVVAFWYQLNAAFANALGGKTTVLCNGKIVVSPMTGHCRGVTIQLPSGAKLYYHDAAFSELGLVFNQAQKGRVAEKKTYGGLLTEHVVSSTARAIMLSGMFHAERTGFEVLNTVHDELWAQGQSGRLKEFDAAMLTLPKWCSGLELTVDSYEGDRYLK